MTKAIIKRLAECHATIPLTERPFWNLRDIVSRLTPFETALALLKSEYGLDFFALAEAEGVKRKEKRLQYERNVVYKTELSPVIANIGCTAIRCDDVTIHDTGWGFPATDDATLLLVRNGHGDGYMPLYSVTVKTFDEPFSQHEMYGDEPPLLVATLNAAYSIYKFDCVEADTPIVVEAPFTSPVRVYARNGKTYLVREV